MERWYVQEAKRVFGEHCAQHRCKPQTCQERLRLWLAINTAALENERLVRHQVREGVTGNS
jgi:hypothetical protein